MPQHPTTVSPQSAETRFAPVNPYARKVAALRMAFLDAVSEQDVREMTYLIVFNAKAGSLEWLKFLFQYAIGKPRHAVDPDTLDVQEFRALQAASVSADAVEKVCNGAPVGVALEVCRQEHAAREAELRTAMATNERPRERQPTAAAPSSNGRDGIWADPWAEWSPSTDGKHGGCDLETLLDRLRDLRAAGGGKFRA